MIRMQRLITAESAKRMAAMRATARASDPIVVVKLFTPFGGWTWLLTEYNPKTEIAVGFAYCNSHPDDAELGRIDVGELQALRTPWGGQSVERDSWFTEKPISEAIAKECQGARSIYPRAVNT